MFHQHLRSSILYGTATIIFLFFIFFSFLSSFNFHVSLSLSLSFFLLRFRSTLNRAGCLVFITCGLHYYSHRVEPTSLEYNQCVTPNKLVSFRLIKVHPSLMNYIHHALRFWRRINMMDSMQAAVHLYALQSTSDGS